MCFVRAPGAKSCTRGLYPAPTAAYILYKVDKSVAQCCKVGQFSLFYRSPGHSVETRTLHSLIVYGKWSDSDTALYFVLMQFIEG